MAQRIEDMVVELEESLPRMNPHDRRTVEEWRRRLNEDDLFDRQDRTDMKDLLESI